MNGTSHANKKVKSLFLSFIVVLFLIPILAIADDGSFYADGIGSVQNETIELLNCGSTTGTTFLRDIPYYIGLNEIRRIDVSLTNNGTVLNNSDINVQASLNMSAWYNMTYNLTSTNWGIFLTSNETEDAEVFIRMTSDVYSCVNMTDTIKFREPYWITIRLYSSNRTSQRNPDPYVNDFNYVYLESYDSSSYLTVPSSYDLSNTMRNIYSFVPGIEKLYKREIDQTIVHWAKYTDGYAVVKLYELGEYDVNLMSLSVNGLDWGYEFFKPQFSDIKVDTRVEKQVNITKRGNYTASIYISKFEADKMGYMMNIAYIIMVVFGLLLAMGGLMILPGMSKIAAPVVVAVVLWAMKFVLGV